MTESCDQFSLPFSRSDRHKDSEATIGGWLLVDYLVIPYLIDFSGLGILASFFSPHSNNLFLNYQPWSGLVL